VTAEQSVAYGWPAASMPAGAAERTAALQRRAGTDTAARRPMPGLKRLAFARTVSTGDAFVQNLRRGHYELALCL